jgi:hypothetical protein
VTPRVVAAPVTANRVVPHFAGYIALPVNSGDSALVAWWTNGSAAIATTQMVEDGRIVPNWRAMTPPDYAALFPLPPVAEPVVVADAAPDVWTCYECDNGPDIHRNLPSATRCGRCGSERP